MNAAPSFGAALVGFGVACFLCGSMLVQVYVYIKSESSRGDSIRFKSLVSRPVFPFACCGRLSLQNKTGRVHMVGSLAFKICYSVMILNFIDRFLDLVQLIFLGCYVYGALIVHYNDPAFLGIGPWYAHIIRPYS
jgi:hypothetical protein